jgi:hypothetical protein
LRLLESPVGVTGDFADATAHVRRDGVRSDRLDTTPKRAIDADELARRRSGRTWRSVITLIKINHTTRRENLMNQSNEARRSPCMIGTLFLTVVVSLALLVPARSAASRPLGSIPGCGVLVDAAHPWRSQVSGGNVETGDHWITDRRGTHSSCAFTHATIRKLLALAPRTYQGRDVGHLEGGLCDWNLGSRRGESIRPFQRITCHVPRHLRHHTYVNTVEAFVDPDPQFIRAGAAAGRHPGTTAHAGAIGSAAAIALPG